MDASGPVFDVFLAEILKAVTVKAGQLCTNIRRVFVPAERMSQVAEAIRAKVGAVVAGDPALPDVTLGPVVHEGQRRSALEGIRQLAAESDIVIGGEVPGQVNGADPAKGAFVAPTILMARSASAAIVHELEVFGPVATLIPYGSADELVTLVRRGEGSLVLSVYGDDSAEPRPWPCASLPITGASSSSTARSARATPGIQS
jgi:acyl-CoA reductase-like NAD-dependent aldehyde dehydrogenase